MKVFKAVLYNVGKFLKDIGKAKKINALSDLMELDHNYS